MFNLWVFIGGMCAGALALFAFCYFWCLWEERQQAKRDFLENDD